MKTKPAFTLMEILIALLLFGIITLVILINSKIVIEKTTNAKMTYSAYNALRKGVGNYIADNGEITSSIELCKSLAKSFNTTGEANCGAILNESFKNSTPNFVLNNGLIFYNFGGNLSSEELQNKILAKKAELEALEETDENYETVSNELETLKNELENSGSFYRVYVDIDGDRGNSKLNEDVIPFIINLYGEVLPDDKAATSTEYLTAGYKYLNNTNEWVWIGKGLSFKDAVCSSGAELQTKSYCTGISVNSKCVNNICQYAVLEK